MKDKIQTLLGLFMVGFVVIGLIRSIYNRNFADPAFEILKSTEISAPIKNALFWHEEELEKVSSGMVNAKLSGEESFFIRPLYEALKNNGMVNEHISTMSDRATQRMIELDAYRGTEPNVWEIAKQNGKPYIFKIIINGVSAKKTSGDLNSVEYLYSLYNTSDGTLLWEAETMRLAGFFGGMPGSEESISILEKHLKESNIIE